MIYDFPSLGHDQDRATHTRERHRMLCGIHKDDIAKAISQHVDPTRQRQWGIPDLSSNVAKSVCTQLSVLHDREPRIENATPADRLLGPDGLLARSGWAPLMSRFASNVIGLREMFMHISVSGETEDAARLLFRPVTPDRVLASSTPEDPERPVKIQELRKRFNPITRSLEWTWDVYSIEDLDNPYHGVYEAKIDGEMGADMSRLFLDEEEVGDRYPYRDATGAPFLPYVLYHAAKTGKLFDAYDGREVFDGSKTAAVLWTFFVHCVRDASWPQRYGVGVTLQGARLTDAGGEERMASVPTDPSSLLLFQPTSEGQAMLGQFQPGANPEVLQAAISQYEARVAEYFGISPSDLQRAAGSARSGYAISVTNSGKREAQRRFTPQFRVGDLESIEVAAKLLNGRYGLALPESGYTIEYQSIPLSEQELKARREDILEQVAAGLMSQVDAYMELHPGVNRDGALRALVRVRADQAELDRLLGDVEPRAVPQFEPEPEALEDGDEHPQPPPTEDI